MGSLREWVIYFKYLTKNNIKRMSFVYITMSYYTDFDNMSDEEIEIEKIESLYYDYCCWTEEELYIYHLYNQYFDD